MFTKIKSVIFDLDGTLIDSMWVWEQIDIDYLRSKNLTVPDNLKDEINHLSFNQTAHYFKERFNLSESIDEIMDTWHNMALYHYTSTINLKDGVLQFLDFLKTHNIKIALATSNSLPLVQAILKKHNILHYFDAISTTEESGKSKQFPDVYLLSASKLSTEPERCLVFEDIIEAVRGAKLANMKVVAISDKSALYQKKDLINESHLYIDSFIDLDKIKKLL